MAIFHRKKLLLAVPTIVVKVEGDSCTSSCWPCSYDDCISPPPPPLDADQSHSHGSISPLLLVLFCVLAVAFSIICYLTLSTRHRSFLRNSLRRNRGNTDETHHDEFIDEDRGPEVHHPIWLINYVGLEQSVIDSIDVVKYKKDEGLIEGIDCSVCLTEFEDDESLRLLPKCSHAFHVPCIDTWLRSHKNCPLCRSPIVNDAVNAHVSAGEMNLNALSSREDTPIENNELGDHHVGENGPSEMRGTELENIGEILEKSSHYLNTRNSGIRVLSDLGDHRGKMGELQPVRRSISMDLSSASTIYTALANIPIPENVGCSDTQLVQAEKPNSQKNANGHKRSSSSIYKIVMKSSSFGISSQKGLISMKRSYSSSGKYSQSSHGRSQDSILPL